MSGAGLMSCVREGSLEPPRHDTHSHGEGKTNRFLRGLRRMFKRRGSGTRNVSPDPRSSSTGELLAAERQARRKEGAYGSGLSVSHDSVFTGERSDESSDERPTPHLPTSHRAELVAAVRRRGRGDGSDDDEDLGLPRSPPASPPTDKADKVENWDEKKKYCSIIFDEVSLEPGVDYDKNKDQVNGFVHLGKKTNQLADHALAFMLRGAIHKWQQPIAYYFCEGSTKNEELRVILKNVINAVIETGLIPVAVICDQGQSFQSALKALLEETRRDQITTGKPIDDVITLKGHDISVIFDPPHLIKGIRNNFLAKNMKFNQKICKWSDIVDVYQTDCEHAEVRLLHKLNDAHVLPEKINKMKRHHAGISQSSCSDGSLLSVGSSEMDEDSSSYHQHDHSSRSDQSDYNLSEPALGVAPLSHSAAKHKMAVRPRRTHGAPRRKKTNPIAATALPITPELNEEMIRSTTPDVTHKTSEVVTESFSSSTTTKHHMMVTHQHQQQQQQLSRELARVLPCASPTPSDTRSKSSSLPPGLALSQVTGHHPAKLSIPEEHTPRSSIKRSKSSSQGQNVRDDSTKPHVTTSETQINSYSQERVKYRSDNKYAEETCHEKKSKSEKKMENEVIRSKKEESFFSRLLLRKSGKKSKKDQPDGEQETKKSKTEKSTAQYKAVDTERSGFVYVDHGPKPVPAERTQKSAGQKVFANQMHKRMDNKGAYVQEGVYKDVYSAAKVSGVEYNITDLKIAEETDKMLNQEMRARLSRRDDFDDRMERSKRTSSKETVEDKRESFSLNHDKSKRPASVQRLVEPFSSKAFINNEVSNIAQEESLSPSLEISDEEPPIRAHMKSVNSDYMFHSGSMPKNIPYFNHSVVMSASVSPPKHVLHQSSENVKHMHRSSDHVCELRDKQLRTHRTSNTEEAYVTSGLRSLGDEYLETRSSIGKSHSFRYASESPSISSQESQMPSLPAIVGISEPLLESWEVNYRRNVSERHDYTKRVSARNYSILHGTAEANYDSLPSTDSSYMDSLKTDIHDDKKLFSSSIQIGMDCNKRDSDISQIEAKIDDIISSPKPILAPIILKSSSLDSVKSSPEKQVEDRRKTISVESSLSQGGRISNNMIQKEKQEAENYVSVTMINKENTPAPVNVEPKNKSDEKLPQVGSKPGVPEFLKIQLNRVDAKPTTNVVLTANVTPKKLDSPQVEKENEIYEAVESKPQVRVVSKVESVENTQIEKSSPVVGKKTVTQPPLTPQSPSTPKSFFIRKSTSVEAQDRPDKARTNSLSTDGSTEKIYDNISIDRKSHSSFGSKSSIQSTDSNDIRTPDRNEETVVYRKKPVTLVKEYRTSERRNDNDEPELMKVFARRSLKLKDCEAETLAQEIAEGLKEDIGNNASRSKLLKNEFNASIKSRDSDKENDDTASKNEENRIDIATRVSQFGAQYQRSVSINTVSNPKRESAPVYRSEAIKYKKEVSDSTPEKRLRNRTFPDPSNDREDIKNMTKSEAMAYKADTLTKRPWHRKEEDKKHLSVEKERESAVIEKEGVKEEHAGGAGGAGRAGGAADAVPQFKGILQMRAEWERRAQQGMTK